MCFHRVPKLSDPTVDSELIKRQPLKLEPIFWSEPKGNNQ